MADARVLVVGSVNVDLVVTVQALPAPGETVAGGRFARHGGGKSANQAVAAARLGADVELVGAVGDDDLGAEAVAALAEEGVGVEHVARREAEPTGVALIVVDAAGENQIAVASGANAALDGAAVERALGGLLGGAEVSESGRPAGLEPGEATEAEPTPEEGFRPPAAASGDLRTTLLLGFEVGDEAVLAAARAGAAAGARLVLNPAPARELSPDLLALGPLLTPNAAEARALTDQDDAEAAARALAEQTGAPVVVTLGAEGALLLDGPGAEPERVPAAEVEVVDTTGAGDAFNGALAAELASGSDLRDAVRLAVAAAGISCGTAGARDGMPARDALERSP